MKINELIFSKMANIYLGTEYKILDFVYQVIQHDILDIVDVFFREIKEVPEIKTIIDEQASEKALHIELTKWFHSLFGARRLDGVKEFMLYQMAIGKKHSNININLHYIHHGIRIIKREIVVRLDFKVDDRNKFVESFYIIDELFDIIMSLISDSYFANLVYHETNTLSMRMSNSPQNVALECEKLRSYLFDWSRTTLSMLLQQKSIHEQHMLFAEYSDFGLWVVYKSDLVLPEPDMVVKLKEYLQTLDIELAQAIIFYSSDDMTEFNKKLNNFNDIVTKTAWHLSTIIDSALKLETGKDPLTNLFNRRYLDTVLKRETEISIRQGYPYAVLLVDADYFKRVNDEYGHDSGDAVLKQISEILVTTVRVSDFVFRYGGEEFLIVLGNAKKQVAWNVAEKIRLAFMKHDFSISGNRHIKVTCSIGVALHVRGSNYNSIIKRADNALYEAKAKGRNQTVWG